MKKSSVKLLMSAAMLVFTAAALVGVTVAWFATNYEVGGTSGNTNIKYDESGGSADFEPGDGFGGDNPAALFPGDRAAYKFSLKNSTDHEKNYVFRFNDMFVTYPAADVKDKPQYGNIVAAVDYEYYDETAAVWRKYNGMRDASDADRIAFYEKFVTTFTNALKLAIVPDDGTPLDDAIAAHTAEFVYLTQVPSYFTANGNVDFYGKTDEFVVDGAVDNPMINDKLASDFTMTVAAGVTGNYRFILVYDGEAYPTVTADGAVYRMKNSNAFMWQSLAATVVVNEIE